MRATAKPWLPFVLAKKITVPNEWGIVYLTEQPDKRIFHDVRKRMKTQPAQLELFLPEGVPADGHSICTSLATKASVIKQRFRRRMFMDGVRCHRRGGGVAKGFHPDGLRICLNPNASWVVNVFRCSLSRIFVFFKLVEGFLLTVEWFQAWIDVSPILAWHGSDE